MALTKVTSGVRTLATSEVATANIAPGAVTGPKIAMGSDAAGDILFRGSSNYERLAKGTAGQKLQMNSGATAPEWVGYRAGEVIETLSLICNGETQTVLSGTYTAPNVTAVQQMTTSWADITGSSIAYTPPSGTSRVIYRFSFVSSYVDAGAIGSFALYLDSDEVVHARSGTAGQYHQNQHHLEWTFRIGGTASTNTGRVASWSSAKTIKVQGYEYSTGYEHQVHGTETWENSSAEHLSVPRITIQAIA